MHFGTSFDFFPYIIIDGQMIKGQITKKRKSGCVVRLLDVLEKSPLEDAKPVCPHFGICGGCFYQTVSYENQLKIKEGMVRDLLKDYVNDDIWEEIKVSFVAHFVIKWQFHLLCNI